MKRSHESWWSPSLGRNMEMLWFGWSGFPVIAFPTSMGRYVQYEDTGLCAHIARKIDAGFLQLVCVDSVDADTWYDEFIPPPERGPRHERYDAYIANEVVPYVRHRSQRGDLGVFGCSFGAYHAANFAGRHPELVTKAVCLSGVYDVHRFTDGYFGITEYLNSPVEYIANMDADWVRRLSRVEWVIATGEYDTLVDDNRRFSAVLAAKGIPHHTEIWPGVFGHDWPFWNEAVERLL